MALEKINGAAEAVARYTLANIIDKFDMGGGYGTIDALMVSASGCCSFQVGIFAKDDGRLLRYVLPTIYIGNWGDTHMITLPEPELLAADEYLSLCGFNRDTEPFDMFATIWFECMARPMPQGGDAHG